MKAGALIKKLIAIAVVFTLLAICWRSFYVMTHPLLIISEDPGSRIFLDGNELNLTGGTVTTLSWRDSCEFKVVRNDKVFRTVIHPLNQLYDSPSILVTTDSIIFDVAKD